MSVIPVKVTSKSKSLPSTAERKGSIKPWTVKYLKEQRVSKLPSLISSNRADIPVTHSIKTLVNNEEPLHVQFRSDGTVIPLEEIIRCCHSAVAMVF